MVELKRGDAKGLLLYFDCFSGLSGDMILSSLIDLGVPGDLIENTVRTLPLKSYKIRVEKEKRRSLDVTRFFVDVSEKDQPHRHFLDIKNMIKNAELSDSVKKLSIDIFYQIAKAEARAHGSTIEKVHFHEVGAVDSIIDIVGAAAAIDYLGATVMCAPIPLGRGFVKTQHGMLPVPAPATMFILEGVPVEGTNVESELTTPTGAAIIKTVTTNFGTIPPMIPIKTGLGAGCRSHETRSGILRVILGKSTSENCNLDDSHFVIEANIDDMTGELFANAAKKLFKSGALDVWTEFIQMKKGRPALKISILCKKEDFENVSTILMRETTTIGLRYYGVGRIEMQRNIVKVKTEFGEIRVKISKGMSGLVNAAPEYEDCKKAADKYNVPLKQIMAIVSGLAQKLINN